MGWQIGSGPRRAGAHPQASPGNEERLRIHQQPQKADVANPYPIFRPRWSLRTHPQPNRANHPFQGHPKLFNPLRYLKNLVRPTSHLRLPQRSPSLDCARIAITPPQPQSKSIEFPTLVNLAGKERQNAVGRGRYANTVKNLRSPAYMQMGSGIGPRSKDLRLEGLSRHAMRLTLEQRDWADGRKARRL